MVNKRTLIEEFDELPTIRSESLLSAYPDLAKQWDHRRNCGWRPEDISYGSKIKVHWKCSVANDHRWQNEVYKITTSFRNTKRTNSPNAYGCPFCNGALPSSTNSLAKMNRKVAKEWNYERNEIKPSEVKFASTKRVWWKCPKGHEYEARINNKTLHSSRCPICFRGQPTDLRKFKKVLSQFDRKNNPGIDPYRLPVGVKVNWVCPKDRTHKWRSGFYRTTGERCPYCLGIKASRQNNLTHYPEFAKQLNPNLNDGILPKDIACGSKIRIIWTCKNGPDHIWSAKVVDRINYQSGCPFCSNKKVSITNSLANTYPKVAQEWHPAKNGKVAPEKVTYCSRTKYFWICTQGHEWSTTPNCRTVKGNGCRQCYDNARARVGRM